MLQFGKEAFYEVSVPVKALAEAWFPLPVGLGGNIGCSSLLLDQRADAVGVLSVVGENECARLEMVENAISDLSIMRLTCCQTEPYR